MITAYIQKATNLTPCDLNGKSDPYVFVFGRTEFASFRFGKTNCISNNLNPVWDEQCQKPFQIEFTRANCLYFEVWDRDFLSKDDLIGYTYFDWTSQKLGEIVELPLTPNFTSKLYVKVLPPKEMDIPLSIWSKQAHKFLYMYCTAQPPLTSEQFAQITLLEYNTQTKGQLANVLTKASIPKPDDKTVKKIRTPFKNMGQVTLLDGRGTTNVLRIKPREVDSCFLYIPAVHNIKGYRGMIVFHFMAVSDEKKSGTTTEKRVIRIVDSSKSADVMQFSLSITDDEPKLLESGIVFSQQLGIGSTPPRSNNYRTIRDPTTNSLIFC